jgi:hypothetical protein
MRRIAVLITLAFSSAVTFAQSATAPSGHWEGTIQIPAQELKVEVDLAGGGETWEGTISVPAQGLKAFPLSAISVQANSVSFAMKGIPGTPTFRGTVAADGKTMSGDFSQGGATFRSRSPEPATPRSNRRRRARRSRKTWRARGTRHSTPRAEFFDCC